MDELSFSTKEANFATHCCGLAQHGPSAQSWYVAGEWRAPSTKLVFDYWSSSGLTTAQLQVYATFMGYARRVRILGENRVMRNWLVEQGRQTMNASQWQRRAQKDVTSEVWYDLAGPVNGQDMRPETRKLLGGLAYSRNGVAACRRT